MILGTVQLGMNYGINNLTGMPNDNEIFNLLNYAYDNGVQIIDTASAYGQSEENIGRFHRNTGKLFNVCTKLPVDIDYKNSEKKDIMFSAVEKSLHILGVPSLYGCYLHRFEQCKNNKIIELLQSCRKEGLIKNIGISIYYPFELEYINNNLREVVNIVQVPINVFSTMRWEKILSQTLKNGIRIFARSVYLQGLVFMKPTDEKVIALKAKRYIESLQKIAETEGLSISELCLYRIVQMKQIEEIILGCETQEQLLNNLELLKRFKQLSDKAINLLEDIGREIPDHIIDPSKWSVYIT